MILLSALPITMIVIGEFLMQGFNGTFVFILRHDSICRPHLLCILQGREYA